ncbi:ABC transporter ATP-binding protein [Collinsella tanakaei]|uniref:ABC transporter ATP-binding protein n=1 Tax=Collinsella tanakaei TaxID=626935 RepID=UPI0024203CCE|nr:ABC transporter ATP-binding protein [Collinsella tanakaei]
MKLLLKYMKPYRGLAIVTVLVLMVDIAGTLLVPTLLANMVNIGVATKNFNYILQNGLAMLGATALASGGALLGSYLSAKLAASVGRDIRNAVYDSSLAFSGSDFERFGTGSMITRTLNDINVIQQSIIMTIQMVLPVPIMCVMGIALATSIDYQMGILLAIVVAVVLVIAVITVANAAPIFTRLQRFIDRMNVVLRENITGVRVIRAFNKEEHENERLDDVFSRYAKAAIKVNWLFAGLDCSAFFLMNIAEVAVLWFGGNRVGAHAMEIGSISAVLEYAMLILFFIMMAQIVALTLPRAKACLDRAGEVIDLVPEIRDCVRPAHDPLDAKDDSAFDAAVTADAAEPDDDADVVAAFRHVTFRFSDADEDTLHNLNFHCRRGQTTAIIGSTGSGKSTVAKLLLRFHDVTGGAIQFNGADVRGMTQESLRDAIAYVPQKAWLFSGTIADNLRFGNEAATEEQMRHALDVAQSQFVYDLPDGLDSRVAQGGTNFSGGQRQRLSIARALMKRADLYIFDDSFSALDFKTDAALRRALVPETRDAATLIIAQRISTILHADQIIVLKDGEMAGIGTHEELMETCEVYRAIAESQMKGGDGNGR